MHFCSIGSRGRGVGQRKRSNAKNIDWEEEVEKQALVNFEKERR